MFIAVAEPFTEETEPFSRVSVPVAARVPSIVAFAPSARAASFAVTDAPFWIFGAPDMLSVSLTEVFPPAIVPVSVALSRKDSLTFRVPEMLAASEYRLSATRDPATSALPSLLSAPAPPMSAAVMVPASSVMARLPEPSEIMFLRLLFTFLPSMRCESPVTLVSSLTDRSRFLTSSVVPFSTSRGLEIVTLSSSLTPVVLLTEPSNV